MKRSGRMLRVALAAIVLAAPALVWGTTSTAVSPKPLAEQVRHELAMLPYYNVFDNLAYKVDGSTVTLYGQVVWPALKDDAFRSVKRLPGVEQVVNKIEVLPLSPFDNQIRRAELRAIYGYPALNRYAMGAVPSIHIIVNNGNVTLVGVVANQMDKNLAGIRANGVPNVFSVKNELQVETT